MTHALKALGYKRPLKCLETIEQIEKLEDNYRKQLKSLDDIKKALALEAVGKADRGTIMGLESSIWGLELLLSWRGIKVTDGAVRTKTVQQIRGTKAEIWVKDLRTWRRELKVMCDTSMGVMGGSIPALPEGT